MHCFPAADWGYTEMATAYCLWHQGSEVFGSWCVYFAKSWYDFTLKECEKVRRRYVSATTIGSYGGGTSTAIPLCFWRSDAKLLDQKLPKNYTTFLTYQLMNLWNKIFSDLYNLEVISYQTWTFEGPSNGRKSCFNRFRFSRFMTKVQDKKLPKFYRTFLI